MGYNACRIVAQSVQNRVNLLVVSEKLLSPGDLVLLSMKQCNIANPDENSKHRSFWRQPVSISG